MVNSKFGKNNLEPVVAIISLSNRVTLWRELVQRWHCSIICRIRESRKHYSTVFFDLFWREKICYNFTADFFALKLSIEAQFSFTSPNEIAEKYTAATVCGCNFAGYVESGTKSLYFNQSTSPDKRLTLRHKHVYSLHLNALRKLIFQFVSTNHSKKKIFFQICFTPKTEDLQ